MKHPRYIVRESSGFRISVGETGGNAPLRTEVGVVDTWLCHNTVWSSWTTLMPYWTQRYGTGAEGRRIKKGWDKDERTAIHWPLAKARAYAAALCNQLNAEHDEWLASA